LLLTLVVLAAASVSRVAASSFSVCYLVFVWCAAGRRAWARRLAPVGRSCHAWPRFGGGSWLWESRPSSSRCRARRNRRITNSSRSYWDSRGGRRVSQGAGARAGSAALHPAANQVVRPGTAGAGAASAKGRARGALMGGSPVSPAIKPFVLGQPGRAPPATGLVMQGLRHPSQPTKSSVPGTAGAGAASHGAGDAGSAASIATNQVVSSWDSRGGRRQPRGW
jgi:hypothetical protein